MKKYVIFLAVSIFAAGIISPVFSQDVPADTKKGVSSSRLM